MRSILGRAVPALAGSTKVVHTPEKAAEGGGGGRASATSAIQDGASCGLGGWQRLSSECVEAERMEPDGRKEKTDRIERASVRA